MPNNRKSSLRRGGVPLDSQQQINDAHNASSASSWGGISPLASRMPSSMHDVEFQPSEICPQNFVIFDETENRRRMMFHPAMAQNLSYPHVDFPETTSGEAAEEYCGNNIEVSNNASPVIEDSDYIDLLLSTDEEDQGESEEEVSTARTQNYDGCSSPESCSNYASKSRKLTYPSSIKKSSVGESSNNGKKRKDARKMVKALRGMIPGGDQMNTAAVFDAAVQQLHGLEDRVQKLGLSNLKHFP